MGKVIKTMKKKEKVVLITGITGQVGSQLADYVLENTNHHVVGMMRWQEPMDNLYHLTDRINKRDRISIHYADLNDALSIRKMLEVWRPDFISHLAAQSYPRTSFDMPIETLQTNIIGTANLLEGIRQSILSSVNPVVHICSSSEVYGKAKVGKNLTEETSFHASSPYSISKIGTDYLGRFYAEAYKMNTIITRMGTHSGPRRSDVFFESTVAKQIALIEAGLQDPIVRVGNLSSKRTFQDARDAVRAYWLLMEKAQMNDGDDMSNTGVGLGSYFNIAGQEAYTLPQIIEILFDLSTFKDIQLITDIDRLRPIDADYQMFDNKKISMTIDWKPEISVRQMLSDLLDHWRDEIAKGKVPLNR